MRKVILCIALICRCVLIFAQSDTLQNTPPKVFTVVEQMPEFPGGDAQLFKFLQENIQYPKQELSAGIEGRVIVGFMLYEDGSVHNVVIKKGVSAGLDQEAKRVIEMLPNFKPGRNQGKAVRVNYVLPIAFKLGNGEFVSVVSKITLQEPFMSALSGASLAELENRFSTSFKNSIGTGNKRTATIMVDFSISPKGDLAEFKIKSGNDRYDERTVKKCLSTSLDGVKSMFPRELFGAKYWMSINVR